MDIDRKRPAIVAAGAFLVAAISAAIGRVGFGALVFRSILGAFVFGAAAVGVESIARKFLPELFTGSTAVGAGDGSVESSVDITLDEENPHGGEHDVHGNTQDDQADVGQDGREVVNANTSIDEGVQVLAEAEEVEELEPIEVSASESTDGVENESALPSFEAVESTFTTAASVIEEQEDDSPTVSSRSERNIDILGEEQDPEAVARAVRTLLKRDNEG